MPNRILKESICTSETIDQLSAEEEVFFYRLLVNCDDYGLMDARETVLRSRLYSLRVDSVTNAVIRDRLASLQEAGLIELYEVAGHPYLHVSTWECHQQVRAKRSKYPRPEQGKSLTVNRSQSDEACEHLKSIDSNGNQAIAHVPVIQSNPIQSNPDPNPIRDPAAQKAPRSRSSTKTEKAPKEPTYPGFQEMWGAFLKEIGSEPLTNAETGKWGGGIKQLLAAGQTFENVPRLVAHYRLRFGSDLPCNPMAIASNLSLLLEEPKPNAKNGNSQPAEEYAPWSPTPEEQKERDRQAIAEFNRRTSPQPLSPIRMNGRSSGP